MGTVMLLACIVFKFTHWSLLYWKDRAVLLLAVQDQIVHVSLEQCFQSQKLRGSQIAIPQRCEMLGAYLTSFIPRLTDALGASMTLQAEFEGLSERITLADPHG